MGCGRKPAVGTAFPAAFLPGQAGPGRTPTLPHSPRGLHTCCALHDQRGDSRLDGGDSNGGDQADAAHGHGAENGARLAGGSLQHHLGCQRKAASHHMRAGQTLRWPSQAPREDPRGLLCSRTGPWGEERARHAAPGSLLAARGQWRFWEQQ